MALQKADFPGTWHCKIPNLILIIFFLIFLPLTRILLGFGHWLYQYALEIYITFVLISLCAMKTVSLKTLGFSNQHLKQNLILGSFSGVMIILSLPILDLLVEVSGLGQTKLMAQIPSTRSNETLTIYAFTFLWVTLHTTLDQLFFFGFIIQSYFKRYNPYFVIYLAGLIFAGAHVSFTVGSFVLGLVCAYLYFLTGTLLAPFLLQIGCHTAGYLLKIVYPRLITLLGFLF